MNIGLMILWSLTTTTAYGQESNSIISKVQFAFDQQALFQRADKNADGIIVLNELVPSRYLKTDKKLEGQFDKLDTDFSGSLSKDEILTAHKKRNVENRKYQKSKRDRLIKKFDLDNNGEISTYEFEQVQASIENDLSKLRKDGVSENLQTAISGLGEPYKTLLDTDTDGSMSEDEILKHLQKQAQGKQMERFHLPKLIRLKIKLRRKILSGDTALPRKTLNTRIPIGITLFHLKNIKTATNAPEAVEKREHSYHVI